jgi:hypothetical protein
MLQTVNRQNRIEALVREWQFERRTAHDLNVGIPNCRDQTSSQIKADGVGSMVDYGKVRSHDPASRSRKVKASQGIAAANL